MLDFTAEGVDGAEVIGFFVFTASFAVKVFG